MVKTEVVNQQKRIEIPEEEVKELVRMISEEEGYGEGEFVITFLDSNSITRLNREYLNRDGDTNVITFSYVKDFNPEIDPVIAEIFINTDRVLSEAREAGMEPIERFWELLIHGILHGFDYEHEGVPEKVAKIMEEKEEYYREKWKKKVNGMKKG